MDLLKNLLLTWRQFRHFQATLADLRNRSEDELAARGIARGDIVRLAYAEAEREFVADLSAGRPAPVAQGIGLAPAR